MKKSKIIFIALLCSIAILILAAFIDIRINGHKNKKTIVSKQTMSSFNVLCINHSKNIEIIQSDSSYIEVTCNIDTIFPNKIYTIKNDTLMISDINKYKLTKIFFKDSLKSILLINSNITIKHFNYPNLSLNMDKSYIWFHLDKNSTSSFNTLVISARNHSNINTTNFKVDSLGILLHASNADLNIISKKISGTLMDSSRMYTLQPEEITMKKDTTSKIYLYD